jgi:hypothetical protein
VIGISPEVANNGAASNAANNTFLNIFISL